MAGQGKTTAHRVPRMPKVPGERKTWTIKITVPGLVCSIGMAGLALTLFFILGLLVGRGYRVEENVPRIAAMMPDSEKAVQVDDKGQPLPEVPEVLKPEDLSYPDNLSKAPAKPKTEEPKPEPAPKETPEPEKKAETEPAQKPEQPAAPKPGEKIFAYVYQAASFRDQAMAREFADKLSGAGLDAEVQSGETSNGTWYRVLVNHTGTPDSTGGMKAILSRFGVKRPLMKQKKPVEAGG
ncbi:SPOR domain-containing protein [Salidesulfovibrio brasiliensis]|uniref:SPOR domain-containing protein n=1 Tax=Salidesulfovibrio brasiliensis TaxID=221711 RepID=UPI0006D2328A|nr:SPOR domain-containing protein [Salidesulfovibrio brasiliensis]